MPLYNPMPKLKIPFPLPEPSLQALPPAMLATAAVAVLRRVYGIELDYTPASLERLERVAREQFRLGEYRRESFPATLALAIGAYIAEMIRRHIDDCRWGASDEDLYCTPLPFLVFSRREYERQVNVVEDLMSYLWSGAGPTFPEYFAYQLEDFKRLGFRINL